MQAQVLADDAIVCRCEEVRADSLRWLVKSGHDTPAELKRLTRVGMGRCQGRYCAATVARMCSAEVGEFSLFAPRPPAKPVPIRLLSVERPEWSGHRDFVPPDMARPVETEPLPVETVDTLVIGGGVAGCCLAYWLAREGIETLVVERDDVNLQASGANAGSLHVQLLSFDFGRNAPAGGNRAADTLPLGPASIALWQEIQRDTGQDLEVKVSGGLMLAETEDDVAFLKSQDRAGEEPRHRGRADRRQRTAPARALHRRRRHRRRMVPGRGQDQSAARHLRGGGARQGDGRALPARQRRAGDRARGLGLEGHNQPRRDPLPAHRQLGRAVGRRGRRPWRASPSRCAVRRCR